MAENNTIKYVKISGTSHPIGVDPSNIDGVVCSNIVTSASNSTTATSTALTNGNVYLNHVEKGGVVSSTLISGKGATTVTTDASGNIIINSTDTNTDTHHQSKNVITKTSVSKTNAAATNGSVWLNHIENDAVRSYHNIKGTGITTVTTDASGNITIDTPNPNTDTHYTSKNIIASSSTAQSNAAATNGNVYLNHIENNAVRSYHKIVGAGAASVTTDASGNITITGNNNIPFIVGTQTSATNAWTGTTTEISSLKDGQSIRYWLPFAGTGSAATLNLTLSDGKTTGAITCYNRGTETTTTHFPAGSLINFTYRSNVNINGTAYTGWFADAYYNSDTYDRLRFYSYIKCGTTPIAGGSFITGKDGVYGNLQTGNSFDITYPILYAGSGISASSTGTNNYIAYNVPITSISLTAYKPVYIKGQLSGTIFTPISTTPLTQTVPTSADGYEYILLAVATETNYAYLLPENPIYAFRGGAFGKINGKEIIDLSASSNTINYTRGDGSTGSVTVAVPTVPTITGTAPISASKSGDSITITHDTVSTASKTYGSTANSTPGSGGSFTVPYISVDKYGHVTGGSTTKITLPKIPTITFDSSTSILKITTV